MGRIGHPALISKEVIQDNIGNILVDTSTINFTYDDANNQITADVISSGLYSDLDTRYLKLSGGTLTGALVITPATNTTSILNVTNAAGDSVLNVDTTNGRVGIGTTGPSSKLHVSGSSEPLRIANGSYSTRFYEDGHFHIARESGGGNLNLTEGWTAVLAKGLAIYSSAVDGSGVNYIRLGAGSVSAPTFSFYNDTNTVLYNTAADKLGLVAGGTESMTITTGNVGIGTTGPTAYLHLKAGTATASTAPLKLTAGTLNTTPEAGAIEFDGTNLYFVNSAGERKTIAVV